MAWVAVITEQGENLLANSISGVPISITEVRGGSGVVASTNLRSQTQLINPKQLLHLEGVKKADKSSIMSVLLDNKGIRDGYTLNQIGFFTNSANGKVLFAIAQNAEGSAVVPESDAPYVISFEFIFSLTNGADVTVVIDPDAYVTKTQLNETYSMVQVAISEALTKIDNFKISAGSIGKYSSNSFSGERVRITTLGSLTGLISINLRSGKYIVMGKFVFSRLNDQQGRVDIRLYDYTNRKTYASISETVDATVKEVQIVAPIELDSDTELYLAATAYNSTLRISDPSISSIQISGDGEFDYGDVAGELKREITSFLEESVRSELDSINDKIIRINSLINNGGLTDQQVAEAIYTYLQNNPIQSITVDSALSGSSQNAIQNKVVYQAIESLINRVSTLENNGSSGLGTVDTALSTTSENPVQNKVIATEISAIKNDLTNKVPVRGEVVDGVIKLYNSKDEVVFEVTLSEADRVIRLSDGTELYNVLWVDDFDGDSVDETKWLFQGRASGIDARENVSVSDSILKMKFSADCSGSVPVVYSPNLNSAQDDGLAHHSFRNVYIEVKFRQDKMNEYTYPCFWLNGDGWGTTNKNGVDDPYPKQSHKGNGRWGWPQTLEIDLYEGPKHSFGMFREIESPWIQPDGIQDHMLNDGYPRSLDIFEPNKWYTVGLYVGDTETKIYVDRELKYKYVHYEEEDWALSRLPFTFIIGGDVASVIGEYKMKTGLDYFEWNMEVDYVKTFAVGEFVTNHMKSEDIIIPLKYQNGEYRINAGLDIALPNYYHYPKNCVDCACLYELDANGTGATIHSGYLSTGTAGLLTLTIKSSETHETLKVAKIRVVETGAGNLCDRTHKKHWCDQLHYNHSWKLDPRGLPEWGDNAIATDYDHGAVVSCNSPYATVSNGNVIKNTNTTTEPHDVDFVVAMGNFVDHHTIKMLPNKTYVPNGVTGTVLHNINPQTMGADAEHSVWANDSASQTPHLFTINDVQIDATGGPSSRVQWDEHCLSWGWNAEMFKETDGVLDHHMSMDGNYTAYFVVGNARSRYAFRHKYDYQFGRGHGRGGNAIPLQFGRLHDRVFLFCSAYYVEIYTEKQAPQQFQYNGSNVGEVLNTVGSGGIYTNDFICMAVNVDFASDKIIVHYNDGQGGTCTKEYGNFGSALEHFHYLPVAPNYSAGETWAQTLVVGGNASASEMKRVALDLLKMHGVGDGAEESSIDATVSGKTMTITKSFQNATVSGNTMTLSDDVKVDASVEGNTMTINETYKNASVNENQMQLSK